MNDGVFFETIILLFLLWLGFFGGGTLNRVFNICYFGMAAYVWNTQGIEATIGFWVLWIPTWLLFVFIVGTLFGNDRHVVTTVPDEGRKPKIKQKTKNPKGKSIFDSIMSFLWKLWLFFWGSIIIGGFLLIYFQERSG